MMNPVTHTTYLAEAADAAMWRSARPEPAGDPRRSGYDAALVGMRLR
jgi:hypothetical protein